MRTRLERLHNMSCTHASCHSEKRSASRCTRAAREASSGRMGSGSPGESTERSSVERISAISVLTLPIGISAARMNSKKSKPIKLKQLCFVPDAHSCIEDATDDIHDVLSSVLWACQWNPRNKSRQLTYRTSYECEFKLPPVEED
jgi:hypothetical protein